MKNITLLFLFLSMLPIFVLAQNEPHFTQQMGNEIMFNPGAIGNENKINTSLLTRKQWYGFDGSPSTALLTADTYLGKIKGGVGLSIYGDKLGNESTINIRAMYAYPIQVNREMIVTLGVGAGFMNKSIQGTKLRYEDNTDEQALFTDLSQFTPDFTFGGELNSTLGFTVGLAATHLHKSVKGSTLSQNPRHYYFYGNYNYELDDNISIIPYLLVKSTLYATQFELATYGTFDREMWWTGLSYRHQDALSLILGINLEKTGAIDQDLRIGYSYDFVGLGGVATHSSGSHEIQISAKFDGLNKDRVKPNTPRLF